MARWRWTGAVYSRRNDGRHGSSAVRLAGGPMARGLRAAPLLLVRVVGIGGASRGSNRSSRRRNAGRVGATPRRIWRRGGDGLPRGARPRAAGGAPGGLVVRPGSCGCGWRRAPRLLAATPAGSDGTRRPDRRRVLEVPAAATLDGLRRRGGAGGRARARAGGAACAVRRSRPAVSPAGRPASAVGVGRNAGGGEAVGTGAAAWRAGGFEHAPSGGCHQAALGPAGGAGARAAAGSGGDVDVRSRRMDVPAPAVVVAEPVARWQVYPSEVVPVADVPRAVREHGSAVDHLDSARKNVPVAVVVIVVASLDVNVAWYEVPAVVIDVIAAVVEGGGLRNCCGLGRVDRVRRGDGNAGTEAQVNMADAVMPGSVVANITSSQAWAGQQCRR